MKSLLKLMFRLLGKLNEPIDSSLLQLDSHSVTHVSKNVALTIYIDLDLYGKNNYFRNP